MRELSIRFDPGELLRSGFPYPGELSWGYRNDWLDRSELVGVVDGLNVAGIPLCEQEEAISVLLSAEYELVDHLAEGLVSYEDEASGEIWCYYVAVHLEDSVKDSKTKFELLDAAWADMDYPDELQPVLFPQEFHPAHVYTGLGQQALELFLEKWKRRLLSRDPSERLRGPSSP
jgi:hypothetical protein